MKVLNKIYTSMVICVLLFSGTLLTVASTNNGEITAINEQNTMIKNTPPGVLTYTLNLPTVPVTMTVYDNQVICYFDTYLSDVPPGYDVTNGGPYLGWCVQSGIGITRGIGHQVMLYSSYDPAMPASFMSIDWYKINYLINHKIGTEDEISIAIWHLCGEWPWGMPPNSQTMVNEANMYGASFIPIGGEAIAVLADAGSTVQRTFFELILPPDVCYESETGWAQGTRYILKKGNWAMYVQYDGVEKTADLIAGQWMDAGDVTFSAPNGDNEVTITFNLADEWIFDDSTQDNNIHIQDYWTAPSGQKPAPGQFTYSYNATGAYYQVTVPFAPYYGVHTALLHEVPCDPPMIWLLLNHLSERFPYVFFLLRTLLQL